ncbi:MAG TPA: hypothetical protein VEB64_18105 [Azospirillaceae bacterium]|nr:hypothetical protein [Azospirillaceae bacterium]
MKQMNVRADLSKALFFDLADRWCHDIGKISARDTDGVRPSKHAAFLAFWMRKIKPISRAYRFSDILKSEATGKPIPYWSEVVTINEQVAIRLAFQWLAQFAKQGKLLVHDSDSGKESPVVYDEDRFKRRVAQFCGRKVSLDGRTVLEILVDDMRYRTFGPHHLAQLFDQFVFSLAYYPEPTPADIP